MVRVIKSVKKNTREVTIPSPMVTVSNVKNITTTDPAIERNIEKTQSFMYTYKEMQKSAMWLLHVE